MSRHDELIATFEAAYKTAVSEGTLHDPSDLSARQLWRAVAALRAHGIEFLPDPVNKGSVLQLSEVAMMRGRVVVMPGQLSALMARYDKLNEKAARFGIEPIQMGEPEEYWYRRVVEPINDDRQLVYLAPVGCEPPADERGDGGLVRALHVYLTYPQIKLGDWGVLAELEAVPGGNLIYALSQDPDALAEVTRRAACPVECEHCKTRRSRTYGYVLRNHLTGEFKEVGKSCLQDFTGVDPRAALFLANLSSVISRDGDPFRGDFVGGGMPSVLLNYFLVKVAFCVRQWGFVGVARARETGVLSTLDDVLALPDRLSRDAELLARWDASQDACNEQAQKVIDWVQSMSASSTFEHNLKLLFSSGRVETDRKHMAFVAAAVPAYYRANRPEAEVRISCHVGVPGQKIEAELRVLRVSGFDTAFGRSFIVAMMDAEGNKIVWKTSSPPDVVFQAQDSRRSFAAKFSVKEHSEYKGECQTGILRLKFVDWVAESANDGLDSEPEDEGLVSEEGIERAVECVLDEIEPAYYGYVRGGSSDQPILESLGVEFGLKSTPLSASDGQGNLGPCRCSMEAYARLLEFPEFLVVPADLQLIDRDPDGVEPDQLERMSLAEVLGLLAAANWLGKNASRIEPFVVKACQRKDVAELPAPAGVVQEGFCP